MRYLIPVALLVWSSAAFAEDLSGFEKIVIPTYNSGVSGERDTYWRSILYAFNGGEGSTRFFPEYEPTHTPSLGALSARSVYRLFLYPRARFTGLGGGPAPVSARLVYVERRSTEDVSFHLEVCPGSPNTAGCENNTTEIPVVREREFRTKRLDLIGISARTDARRRLRIYDPDRTMGAAVLVRLYVGGGGVTDLAVRPFPLTVTTATGPGWSGDETFPGYAEIDLDRNFPIELASVDRLNARLVVEVTPITANLRFWAMVTVTDNATQHVTTITPH